MLLVSIIIWGLLSLAEVDRMMENTDPEYWRFVFDTGQFTYYEEDPLEVVEENMLAG